MSCCLLMISAMYENGGNTTHRHLDGHPELHVYPFESQPGTKYIADEFASTFPYKYRWPVFPLENTVEADFELMFDEEAKTRIRRPDGSKFRECDLQLKEEDRTRYFKEFMKDRVRTTGNLVLAYYASTFKAWKNLRASGRERYYVGYSPIIGVDSERIFADLPDAKVIHVVRSPLACLAETRRRPYPLSIQRYIWTWNLVQMRALAYQKLYPRRFILVRYEDMLADKRQFMQDLSAQLGISFDECLLYPSWNGEKLENQYPWGTIDFPNEDEQKARIAEIPPEDYQYIKTVTQMVANELKYEI